MLFTRLPCRVSSSLLCALSHDLRHSHRINITPHINLRPAAARHLSYTPVNMSSTTPYQIVSTDKAPAAIGAYSQATVHNGVIYCSGSVPFDPKTMELVKGEIEAEVTQAMQNMLAIVEAAGGDKGSILKTTVFVKDIGLFGRINTVYEQILSPYKPARSLVEAARLPRDVNFEIECIAAVKA